MYFWCSRQELFFTSLGAFCPGHGEPPVGDSTTLHFGERDYAPDSRDIPR